MIRITPTPENIAGLSPASDYTITLPGDIDIASPKTIATSRTIGGTSTVTVWPSAIGGSRRQLTRTVTDEEYRALRRIESASVHDWVLATQDRRFVIALSLLSVRPGIKRLSYAIVMEIVFVREL